MGDGPGVVDRAAPGRALAHSLKRLLPEVRALATRLLILHHGRVVHDSPLRETAEAV